MPAPLPLPEPTEEIQDVIPVMNRWVRGALVGMALGLMLVFGIARWLNPYENGQPRRLETHVQLGLPPCNFRIMTGMPCPSCGMTTSFALLVRGDLENSLRANAAGTLLALFGLVFIPWGLVSSLRGRTLFIVSLERALTCVVIVFLGLMLIRWVIVIGLGWWNRTAL